jgi:hypothetical protein
VSATFFKGRFWSPQVGTHSFYLQGACRDTGGFVACFGKACPKAPTMVEVSIVGALRQARLKATTGRWQKSVKNELILLVPIKVYVVYVCPQ